MDSDRAGLEASDIDVGRAVLATEAEALHALAAGLGAEFARAVALLADTQGRVVVSGMGKSGHVGRKIAATLASTGTPSFFVHPGEASHGDLGMIIAGDAVLALSNSGETSELEDLLLHVRRLDLTLVAIVGRAGSTLARLATVALVLPAAPEACASTLAPTTSTTMQLALGDALAVALLTRRGFSADDFGVLHPRGRLGARLRRVAEIMHVGDAMPLVGQDVTMSAAILVMTAKRLGCVGITDADGRLVGIVTDGDLRRAMAPGLTERPAASVMTRNPRTIPAEATAGEALAAMEQGRSITQLFVVDEDRRPLGVVHVHDLLRLGLA